MEFHEIWLGSFWVTNQADKQGCTSPRPLCGSNQWIFPWRTTSHPALRITHSPQHFKNMLKSGQETEKGGGESRALWHQTDLLISRKVFWIGHFVIRTEILLWLIRSCVWYQSATNFNLKLTQFQRIKVMLSYFLLTKHIKDIYVKISWFWQPVLIPLLVSFLSFFW